MEIKNYSLETKVSVLLFLFYAVGILGHSIESTLPYMILLTPWTLLISNTVVFFATAGFRFNKRIIFCVGVLFIVTFSIEAIGVHTGFPFGVYSYGSVLGMKILSVPLIIGFNWVIIILGLVNALEYFKINPIYRSLLVGVFAVLFDYVLEPVAINLHYWNWNQNIIPMQNYAAWLIIATFSALFIYKLKITFENYIAAKFVGIQFLFFIMLSLVRL